MVPFNLLYYRPDTIPEALDLYQRLRREHRNPAFYGGGTEILTRTRIQDAHFDAVIDLKGIPELKVHQQCQNALKFGAALSLTDLADENLWPLLTATVDRVADHTSRGQITLGGNLFSTLPYREAMLPFLIMDSAQATVASPTGIHTDRFQDLYDQSMKVKPGEFLIAITVDGQEAQSQGFRSRKMTRIDWIDYPLVTIALSRRDNDQMRAAFSGWTRYPFVSGRVNKILSSPSKTASERAQDAIQHMPMPALSDIHGSKKYREFVAQYTLAQMLTELEEEAQ